MNIMKQIKRLLNKEYYYHYSFDSLEQYIEKINKYSTLSAIDNKNKGKKFNLIRFFLTQDLNLYKSIYLN